MKKVGNPQNFQLPLDFGLSLKILRLP
jgi:hypothetical protein